MNISFDQLKEVKSFDVIFVGHHASIAARLFASLTKDQYTCLVLSTFAHNFRTIIVNSGAITGPFSLKGDKMQTKELKIISIKPISKQIELQGGKVYDYKYLVYSGNLDDWANYNVIETLTQALSNEYSLVYSNIKKRDISAACQQISSGNVVFYVPKGSHSGFDNFNFLTIIQTFQQFSPTHNHAKPLTFKIILEGTQFFPHSQQADNIIKKEIRQRGIQVFYNSQLTKIDYLRRTLSLNDKNQLPYNFLYCFVPQKVPAVLKACEIDPFQNNPRTLQNRKYKNVFVYGADIFPTTHTFQCVQYQAHYIAKNLDHLLSKTGQISVYNGITKIPIYVSSKQVVEVVHYYNKKRQCDLEDEFEPQVSESCSWLTMLIGKLTKNYIAQSYYNYKSYGAPYYIFAPALPSLPLIQDEKPGDMSEPFQYRISKRMDTNQKMVDQENMKVNHTAEHPKNGPRMLRY